uniref:Major capsid protein n=1 Tax=viral metagenome TaxID=1070528 RepID=A0A6H1ZZZ3_9ZZZZ
MYWKQHRAYKDDPMSNTDTWKEELPEKGILSGIILQFHMTNANLIKGYYKARLIDHLTKIEVTDGGTETMASLTGQEFKAQNFYDEGKIDHEMAILFDTNVQRTTVYIPFGRHFKDPDYMLDLGAWDSVYLELTNDLTTTYCADKAAKVDVQLVLAEDLGMAPANYIKNYEWRNNKPKADAQYVYHKLPTRDVIRRVMVQTDPDLNTVGSAVSDPKGDSFNLKFTFREGSEVVWDHRPKDIMKANALDYGLVKTRGRYYQSTSQYIDTAVGYVANEHFAYMSHTASSTITAVGAMQESNDRFQVLREISAGTNAPQMIDMQTVGVGYYHTMVLFDAGLKSVDQYLDPGKEDHVKGPVDIEWYGHTDDHTLRTCLSVPMPQGEA